MVLEAEPEERSQGRGAWGFRSHITFLELFASVNCKILFCREVILGSWKHLEASSSVQSLSHVRLFATPRTAARQASLSIANSQNLLKLMSIESVMPNYLILCRPLLFLLQKPIKISILFSLGNFRATASNLVLRKVSLGVSKVPHSGQWCSKLPLVRSVLTKCRWGRVMVFKHKIGQGPWRGWYPQNI